MFDTPRGATRVQRISAGTGWVSLCQHQKGLREMCRQGATKSHCTYTVPIPHCFPLLPILFPLFPPLLTRPLLAPLGFLLLLVLHFVVVLLTRFQSTCIQACNLRTGWTEAETGCANGRGGPGDMSLVLRALGKTPLPKYFLYPMQARCRP